MFGYVIMNCSTLTDEQQARFRALYCGMCRTLKKRYGNLERFTLSYDMTFLAMLLSALYEPDETNGTEKCPAHPFKSHPYVENSMMEYAVDLNVMLAYHKCIDNWHDEHSIVSGAAAVAFRKAYHKAALARPAQEKAISDWMNEIRNIETTATDDIDAPVNSTGQMLGQLFTPYCNDIWNNHLYTMGNSLGQFIYFMDAYEDLPSDIRHKRFNPLRSLAKQDDYESLCKDVMTVILADCADVYEMLPIVKDADLIRNIIYSGVWSKYRYIQNKKKDPKADHKAKGVR